MAKWRWKKWSEEEENILRKKYDKLDYEVLAKEIGVSKDVIARKVRSLGLSKAFKWSKEQVAMLREQYKATGPKQLSFEMGIPYWVLLSKAKRLGIDATRKLPPKNFEWTPERDAMLKDRYVSEGGDKLAEEFNVTLDTVRGRASKLGLHTIAGHTRWGKLKSESSDVYDLTFFDEWSPSMAYILGFLFADGSVNENLKLVSILLASKDKEVLEFIRNEICPNKKIYHYSAKEDVRTGKTNQPRSLLTLNSKVLVNRLMQLGMLPRKTYNDDPYPKVPDDVFPHFVRGYLDGDGTTSISNKDVCSVGFVGSVKFITGLVEQILRLVDMRRKSIYVKKGKNTDYASINWNAAEDIKKFFEFAYPKGFEFCLKRKHDNLVKWLSVPRLGRGQHMKSGLTPI